MTFVAAITTLSERFLTERAFELIVAPALADFEYDEGGRGSGRVTRHLAVLAAVLGACRDDAMRGGHLGTFAGLALIPICYYTIWFLLWLPQGVGHLSGGLLAAVAAMLIALSLAPVIVCFWPGPAARRTSPEQP